MVPLKGVLGARGSTPYCIIQWLKRPIHVIVFELPLLCHCRFTAKHVLRTYAFTSNPRRRRCLNLRPGVYSSCLHVPCLDKSGLSLATSSPTVCLCQLSLHRQGAPGELRLVPIAQNTLVLCEPGRQLLSNCVPPPTCCAPSIGQLSSPSQKWFETLFEYRKPRYAAALIPLNRLSLIHI